MTDERIGIDVDGRYRIEREIGDGVSGVVYAATQLAIGRTVAVKLLHDAVDDDFAKRFETEARSIGRLNHPNIITLHDFGWCDEAETYFMVMEVVEGELLADRMMSHMSTELMVHVGLGIARALAHAHEHSVLHRDLKPENVMLAQAEHGEFDGVKVLDFGLARLLERSDGRPTLRPPPLPSGARPAVPLEAVAGSPAYMSPEQCQGHALDESTDIYSLGVMLFELLEGFPPFDADSAEKMMQLHLSQAAPEMQNEDVSPEIRELVASMLDKSPSKRPRKAARVVDVLNAWIVSSGEGWEGMEWSLEAIEEASEGIAEPVEDFSDLETAAPAGRKRGIAAIGIIVLLLLLGLVILVLSGSDDEPEDQIGAALPTPEPVVIIEEKVKVLTPEEVSGVTRDTVMRARNIGSTAAESFAHKLKRQGKLKPKAEEPKVKKKKKKLRELKLSL